MESTAAALGLPSDSPTPLEGIVVADFSRVLAGPYCTMLLGDLGATVIKVESPAGDDTRWWSPPSYRDESCYYHAVNRNKHSITLDFGDEDDLAIARDIAARADVFIHNFRPGSIEKFGLGYEGIREINPSIIYSHITGFGSRGGAKLPGYDVLVQGFAGLMHMCGDADGRPTRSGVSFFDLTTGMMTALGIVAALRHRERTGEGQKVENNLMANAVFTMANQHQVAATTGVSPKRSGDEHATIYPYNAFPTGDGDLIVVGANNGQFTKLAAVLGHPEWPEDPRFETAAQRNVNRDELRPLMEEALSHKSKDEWFALLRDAGLPCAPVQDINESIATAEELDLHPVWTPDIEASDPEAGVMPTIRNPLEMSATPPTYRKEPPGLGADSEAVRAWIGQTQPKSAEG